MTAMFSIPTVATRPRRLPARVGRIDFATSLDVVRADWTALESFASPYQSFAFIEAWFATVGAAKGATPGVAIARDAAGQAIALLPLAIRRWGPLAVAGFPGGRDANFNIGLFRPNLAWTGDTIRAVLDHAARAAGVDAFALFNQPFAWDDRLNPLALIGGSQSPSRGARCDLPGSFDAWVQEQGSKSARKKTRHGTASLATLGTVEHVLARNAAEADPILDAFLAQKRAAATTGGAPNPYATPSAEHFLRRLAHEGLLELHALTLDGRPVAVFGGLVKSQRLSGLLLSHDSVDREVARHGPGRLLLTEVVRSAIARDFTGFDLGTGESDYKDKFCPLPEPLFDSAFGVTVKGAAVAALVRTTREAKRRIKRSPRFYALVSQAQRVLRAS